MCVSQIVKHDFPGRWPQIVEKISIYLQNPDPKGITIFIIYLTELIVCSGTAKSISILKQHELTTDRLDRFGYYFLSGQKRFRDLLSPEVRNPFSLEIRKIDFCAIFQLIV